jgi:uncharacterized membrane protein
MVIVSVTGRCFSKTFLICTLIVNGDFTWVAVMFNWLIRIKVDNTMITMLRRWGASGEPSPG